MNIEAHIDTIRGIEVLDTESFYKKEHWLNTFKNTQLEGCVIYIINNYETISRRNIIEYLRNHDSSLLTGFLMAMVWCHGYDKNGRADNRGHGKFPRCCLT